MNTATPIVQFTSGDTAKRATVLARRCALPLLHRLAPERFSDASLRPEALARGKGVGGDSLRAMGGSGRSVVAPCPGAVPRSS